MNAAESGHTDRLAFVSAGPEDLAALEALIFIHGPNPWNWLPADGVKAHIQDIANGRAHALLALNGGALVGAATFCGTHHFRHYQNANRADALHGYVCEVVVQREAAGRGLGAELLRRSVQALVAMGMQEVYIDRHEENAASAGMMRKAGFVCLETFAEPQRRPHGSGRTTVCRWLALAG